MKKNVKVEKIFYKDDYNYREMYGYFKPNVVYALYDDNTWEKICVYDASNKVNKNVQLGQKFNGRDKELFLTKIKELIDTGKFVCELFI